MLSEKNTHLTGRVSKRQLEELERISKQEKIDRSSALRKVLDIGIAEYNKGKAVEEYRKGKVSIGKASELADVSIAEFYKILEEENIPIRIDLGAIRRAVEEEFPTK
jgi:metal-responsive CopG/Arc/MetJ family transcriptional regulator